MSFLETVTASVVFYPSSLTADSFSLDLCGPISSTSPDPTKGVVFAERVLWGAVWQQDLGELSQEGLSGLEETWDLVLSSFMLNELGRAFSLSLGFFLPNRDKSPHSDDRIRGHKHNGKLLFAPQSGFILPAGLRVTVVQFLTV